MRKLFYSCLTAMCFFTSALAQSDMPVNPFIQHIYTADPSARVVDVNGTPTLFVYPSQDMRPAYGCDMMDNYHVFSTTNMVDWTDHGRIFGAAEARQAWGLNYPVRNDNRDASFMWAPDCIEKDGTYYYYFPHPLGYPDREGWDNWRIGIATATSPDMKENFAIHDTTLIGLPTMGFIDPNIFKDYDGTYYFYYGGSQRCFGAKLADNMFELAEDLKEMTTQLPYFHEGAWVFSRITECNDTIYYMTYPGNNSSLPNYVPGQDQMLYATSIKNQGGSPLGPWTYQGSFLPATGCDTSHGSVVEFDEQWYVFYHNSSLSGHGNLRSICVDKMFFEDNCSGRIIPVIQTGEDREINIKKSPPSRVYTDIPGFIYAKNFNNGGEGIGFHEKTEENTGGLPYRLGVSKSVDIAGSVEGTYITDFEADEWLAYDVNVTGVCDTFIVMARVASADGGSFYLEHNDEKIAVIDVPNTGGLNQWQTIIVRNVAIPLGRQTIKIVSENGNFNLNYLMFSIEGNLPTEKTVAFQNDSRYVTLVGTGLRGNKTGITALSGLTDREKFIIEVADADKRLIMLKSVDNTRYVRTSTSQMTCNTMAFSIGDENKFYWCILRKDNGYNLIALKSYTNNKIVQAFRNDANRPLRAAGEGFGDWEKFIWYDVTPLPPCTNDDCNCVDDDCDCVRVGNNCECDCPNSINNVTSNSKVTIYPVPANENITVAVELNNSSDVTIAISDLQGKTLQTVKKNVNSGLSETNINVGDFASGMYLVNVLSSEFNVVKKIIVE